MDPLTMEPAGLHSFRRGGAVYNSKALVEHLRRTAVYQDPCTREELDDAALHRLSRLYQHKTRAPCDLVAERRDREALAAARARATTLSAEGPRAALAAFEEDLWSAVRDVHMVDIRTALMGIANLDPLVALELLQRVNDEHGVMLGGMRQQILQIFSAGSALSTADGAESPRAAEHAAPIDLGIALARAAPPRPRPQALAAPARDADADDVAEAWLWSVPTLDESDTASDESL